ncbi:MAG: DNA gyrase inhibitor YacG [Alphaproteobacteria bacterium]|nr:DNA gyrase inhibitor YacG [Alphaproteobacteria bacterium]
MQTRAAKCPICSKPTDPQMRPFCSKRCADVDLHRWLSGSYVVPGAVDDEDEPQDNSEA